jgi:hypothetical protein
MQAGTTPPQGRSVVVVVVEPALVVVVVGPAVVVVTVVVVVGLPHGSGVHVPAPRLVPPSSVHCAAVSTLHVNAPMTEPGRQHWIRLGVVVVVTVVVVVVVLPHGSGEHVPAP